MTKMPNEQEWSTATNTDIPPLLEMSLRFRDEEPGLGIVSITRASHQYIFNALASNRVAYSPRYQRGFNPKFTDTADAEGWYDTLYPIGDPRLLIDQRRCDEMAVRWLRQDMTNRDLEWNLRRGGIHQEPEFDPKSHSLKIFEPATIPDSGHRHRAIYTLVGWKRDSKRIPASVTVDGWPVKKQEIVRLLKEYDPNNTSVTLKILNVKPEMEGMIFDQANNLTKPATPGAGYDINADRTPESRFVHQLMERSRILAEPEVERRSSRITATSRKATTLSTLVQAAQQMQPRLAQLEQASQARYVDLLDFMVAFWEEYANHYREWQPGTPAAKRWALRTQSYAMSNVLVHPLFGLAWEIWQRYERDAKDWRNDAAWKHAVAKLTRTLSVTDSSGVSRDVRPLDQANSEWQGRIVIKSYNKKTGEPTWSLSNTRQTRKAALDYLLELTELTPVHAESNSSNS